MTDQRKGPTVADMTGVTVTAMDPMVIDRLARIETKLDLLAETRTSTETRLARLERFMWGAMAVGITGGAPTAVALFQTATGK